MPLPKIATPTYSLELPSTGKPINYRPFLVKEEKLLVIALESEDNKQITTAIKAVIKACVLTKGIKVETLPTFDIEYLFLNIRGKSVGEELEVNIVCPDDKETTVQTTIYLDDIKCIKSEGHTNQIKLAVQGMNAQYKEANGYEGRMLQGKPAQTSGDVFRSQAQLVKAMSDPQYDKDPAYRQAIYDKLERSNIEF